MHAFDALSDELRTKLTLDGIYNPRRWKAHALLRSAIMDADLAPFLELNEKIWALWNKTHIKPVCVVCGGITNFKNMKEGFRRTCSVTCASQDPHTKTSIKQTTTKRYGGHHTQNKEWMQKHVNSLKETGAFVKGQATFEKNFGVKNRFQLQVVKDKIATTNLARYGFENAMSNPEVAAKTLMTTVDRYGAAFNPKQTKSTNLIKYGFENAMSNLEVARRARASAIRTYETQRLDTRLASIREAVQTELLDEPAWWGAAHSYSWQHICGRTFSSNLVDGKLPICPTCKPRSKPQEMVRSLLEQLGVIFIENDRKLIKPYEVDFLLPDYKLAVEVNGVYWHSDDRASVSLLKKTELVEQQGYQLLHLWDLEITDKFPVVEGLLRAKLGFLKKFNARSCKLLMVPTSQARAFLQRHHLQGAAAARWHRGLYFRDELVAVASFTPDRFKLGGDIELVRFASLGAVRGALSRLVNWQQKEVPVTILSYADRRLSRGAAYLSCGFDLCGETPPGYFYFKSGKILSRQQAQKHKLALLLGKNFDPRLSERENMEKAGWVRCLDSGHLRFRKIHK
ncbi:MAG: hypothetical protein DDT31_00242 [Syntrophomonadaceae bacterium]|nr:hypothetical protein [Bacillota bacterium]